MNQNNEQLFSELSGVLSSLELTDVDVFDLIGYLAAVQPDVAQSLCYHIRDILGETEDDADYSHVIAEGYRRAFFDPVTAKMYGTAHYVNSEHALRLMVDTFKTQYEYATRKNPGNVVLFRPAPTTVQ